MEIRLVSTVLDTTRVVEAAAFYRDLLGWEYRRGQGPTDGDDVDWIVVEQPGGAARLAFQLVDQVTPSSWPDPAVPQQLHLDFAVDDVSTLERNHSRVLELGGRMLLDRSDDADEPLFVFADLDGHPFCIFVG